MMKRLFALLLLGVIQVQVSGQDNTLPDTGISGVYEVMVGTDKAGQPWLSTEPVFDDLYGLDTGEISIKKRRVGEPGITLHSLYTPELGYVHELAEKHGLEPSAILENEFSEQSFMFTGPDGVTWQILEQPAVHNEPVTKFELVTVDN